MILTKKKKILLFKILIISIIVGICIATITLIIYFLKKKEKFEGGEMLSNKEIYQY